MKFTVEWYVWNVETGVHIPELCPMEEAWSLADTLNEQQPCDGVGWTASPNRRAEEGEG